MVLVFLGDAIGLGDVGRRFDLGLLLTASDAEFNFADGTQVLVQFAVVGCAKRALQPVGIFGYEIENALFVEVSLSAGLRSFTLNLIGKQPFEDLARIDFLGHGRGVAAPGKIG